MKFRIGDKVVCNKRALSGSKTASRCGLEGEMEIAARDSYVMTVKAIVDGKYTSLRLEHKKFSGDGWWFHSEDLKHHNLILENK